ncbi:MAG: amidohydrolase family protein [Thermodesulfobacteriota bacterium]
MTRIFSGWFQIPPFHDAHVHFMRQGKTLLPTEGRDLIRQFLSHGIFSVAELGHQSGFGLKFKKEIGRSGNGTLKIISGGYALHKKGRYGAFLGKGVSGRVEIRSAIQNLFKEGADFIKIINSGLVSFTSEEPVTAGGFTDEEWKIIREEADKYRLPVRCHANSGPAIAQALRFGPASIEHGFFISEENLRQMVRNGTAWTPTAVALLGQRDFISEAEKNQLDRILEHHLNSIRLAANLGVKLQIGTDSGSRGLAPGGSYFRELELFQKAKLSQEQILSAACLSAEEIGLGNFLLVDTNFIEKKRVESVFYKGKPLDLVETCHR